uniref:Uncharacterized protein n=1 Tax=Anguilla anguilla TaxID=7936 RepID=A0A0E9UIW0_ANGAN
MGGFIGKVMCAAIKEINAISDTKHVT